MTSTNCELSCRWLGNNRIFNRVFNTVLPFAPKGVAAPTLGTTAFTGTFHTASPASPGGSGRVARGGVEGEMCSKDTVRGEQFIQDLHIENLLENYNIFLQYQSHSRMALCRVMGTLQLLIANSANFYGVILPKCNKYLLKNKAQVAAHHWIQKNIILPVYISQSIMGTFVPKLDYTVEVR